jgi:hypothetical protein
VLSSVLKRVDPDQQLRVYGIWGFWNDEVGSTIARRAQPLRFRDGVLVVSVATHTWMQELRFMKDAIRDRLNARLGANLVHDIYFVSGQVKEPAAPADVEPPPAEPAGPSLIVLPPMTNAALADAFSRVVQARAKRFAGSRRKRSTKVR